MAEVVASLSEVANKEISYVSPTPELFVEALTKAGVIDQYIRMFVGFSKAIKQGEFETINSDLENLLGRKPTSAREFLKEVYTSKN
jgi:NAD(P)H dehydrogenase (quinone)